MSTFLASPTAKKKRASLLSALGACMCDSAANGGPDHPAGAGRASSASRAPRRAGSVEALAAAHYNDGAALQQRGALREAVRAYEQAILLDPAMVDAHYNLGAAHQELAQPELAAACYARVVALRPAHHLAHYNLGHCRQELRDVRRREEGRASSPRRAP